MAAKVIMQPCNLRWKVKDFTVSSSSSSSLLGLHQFSAYIRLLPVTSRVVCPVPARWHLPCWGCDMIGHSSLWPSGSVRMSCRPFPITLGIAVRILLAFADLSILAKWPNSIGHLFWIIEVRSGWSVIRWTSWLDTTLMPAYIKDPPKTPLVQYIDLTCICYWHHHHYSACTISVRSSACYQ